MAITAIITGINIANFRAGEKSKRVQLASDTVINAARTAQNSTLTGKAISSSCANHKAVSYILRVSNPTTWVVWGEDSCGSFNAVESYTLPMGTTNSVNLTIDGSIVSGLQIKFVPPYGIMTASSHVSLGSGPFNAFTSINIPVQTTDGSIIRTVRIDGVAGRIGE
jgi:hypothetical protein